MDNPYESVFVAELADAPVTKSQCPKCRSLNRDPNDAIWTLVLWMMARGLLSLVLMRLLAAVLAVILLPGARSVALLAGVALFLALGWYRPFGWDYRCNDCGHKWKVR